MMRHMKLGRVMLAACAGVALVTGCDRLKTELLAPQNPGIVDPSAVGSRTAALALRVGALGRFKQVVNAQGGEAIWSMGGTLVDEYKNADYEAGRITADQRILDPAAHNYGYDGVTQSRGFIRDAIAAMRQYAPDSTSMIGELYMELAFMEMTLADTYCNGIPLGHTINGEQTNGTPLPYMAVYDSASAHLDTALLNATGSDAYSLFVNRAARVLKGRVMIDRGQFAAAVGYVGSAAVPTTFQYDMTFSATGGGSNGLWTVNNSVARISVADSFDIVGGAVNVIRNALPFASANDPRVPVCNGETTCSPKVAAEDGVTKPFYVSLLYKNQYDPLVLASGIDARLIEAEAKLQAQDIAGMMTILNALRTATPRPAIGLTTIPAMTALATPANQAAAVTLFFREKAFWTFGRGQRLPDLRRLVRQYNRPQDQVFPTGVYFKGGNYGIDVNYPVPVIEQRNPLFKGCLDRNA